MQADYPDRPCPECGEDEIVHEEFGFVCEACGLVIEDSRSEDLFANEGIIEELQKV